MSRLFFILVLLVSVAACNSPAKKQLIQGQAQGTYYAISYYGDKEAAVLQHAIDSLLLAFDASLSTYKPNSLISRLNRNDTTVVLNNWLIDNIELARQVSETTNGLFDISIGPIAAYWGFGHLPPPDKVSQKKIDSLLQYVGYQKMRIENNRLVKTVPELQLNCNAIAQGYSVDVLSRFLLSQGIKAFLVDVGGEIYANDVKPDGTPWRVAIELPNSTNSERIYNTSIHIKDEAIATSGNYRKFYEIEGKTYVHSINPKTGYPVENNVLSATVIAPTAAVADAYATACMLLGVEGALDLAVQHPELKIYLMYNNNGQLTTVMSDSFKAYLE